jgi:acetolactate synthase-1/2/3 large subunit
MAKVKVSDFIADWLYKRGITDVFMLSGGGAIYLDEAISKHKGIRGVCIKNEATGPMMAEAYARTKGGFGVVYVTTGPGGANAVTGVTECYVDSSPVLVISGQSPVNQTTKNANITNLRSYGIQELNIIDIVKPITKYAAMITRPESILYELEKAVSAATSGRMGPVWLDIPLDIQSAYVEEDNLFGFSTNKKFTDKIAEDLCNAKRPLILAGQGIKNSDAVSELKRLASCLECPIILSRLGLDCLPYSNVNNMGLGGIKGTKFNKLIMGEADVVIAIGTSLSVAFAGYDLSFFNPNAKIYMVDIELAEITKVQHRLSGVVIKDAQDFLRGLLNILYAFPIRYSAERKNWFEHCLKYKEKLSTKLFVKEQNPIDIYFVAKKIDEMSKKGDILVDDAGSSYYVAGQTFSFENGVKEITSGAYASMGLSIPLSIGAAIADPKVCILTMTGDGSLETNIQELKTLSYYKLNVKLFIINNGGYISMRDHGRHVEDENTMLNIKKVADAYDIPYYLIDDYKNFDTIAAKFKDVYGPAIIEIICDSEQKLILPIC